MRINDKPPHVSPLPDTPIHQNTGSTAPEIIELLNTKDQYQTVVMSTAHLSVNDQTALDQLSANTQLGLVMKRDTGWFIKLNDEVMLYERLSDHLNALISQVLNAGYQMIEFDCDGRVYQHIKAFS